MIRIVSAIILAGVAGTLLNAGVAGIVLGTDKFALALVPGRYAVAVLCALILPVALQRLDAPISHGLAIAFLIIAPSLIAKFVFGAGAPWVTVLALNAVYAIATWGVYVVIARR